MKATCTLVMAMCLFLFTMEGMGQTTPLAANGRLKIINRQLSNESGTAIQLRGMSSHGLQWFPQCYTASSLQALANDWGADVFRAAMYVDEGGYTTNPTAFRARIVQLVNWAEQYGMYCIIDWHILNPGDPNVHTAEAVSFFSYMAQQFAGKKNVIYEICNEPNGVQWPAIKSYAEQVIPAIRQYDSQGIILVGTPNYSGTPWDVLSNPLSGANAYNVMYTYHFYSGSHYLSSVKSNLENVLAQVPLFVSEWGTSNYSGNGGNDYTSAQVWMDFLAGGNNAGIKVSWTNWNFADKDETSSALTPGACNDNAWNSTSTSGTWVKNHILNPADNFGPSTPSVSITSPANNSTATTGSSVTINANVSNATASTVQFYDGSSLLGTDNTAPYSWMIAAIAAGSHSFTAKAVLSSSTITSAAVTIMAGAAPNQAPTVSLTAPANGANYTAPATINLTATASDADGSISKVEFYNGSNKLGEDATAPYTYSWTNVGANNYTITAKAYDNGGVTTTSAGINMVVTAPSTNQSPTVAITAPVNNASYTAPAAITITANASDADGRVSKVEFYSNNGKLGEATVAPYSYNWTNVAAGTYSITAKATDNSNATTTSGAITVIVSSTTTPTSGISGPACAAINNTLVFQLGAADRVNATNYQWWVNGSTQSITPGANGSVTINFGPYFTGGSLWVGVNYSADPWYKQFSKNITLCSGARTAAIGGEANAVALEIASIEASKTGYVYPSPSNSYFTFVADTNIKGITVTDGIGRPVYQTAAQRTGQRITFGESFSVGTYFVQISYADASRKVLTVVKIK